MGLAALAGLLAGAAGLSTAHLIALLTKASASPIFAVGGTAVDSAPRPAKEFAIDNFGTNDKVVLVTGIVIVVALLTMFVGVIASHRFRHGVIAVACLGAVAISAVLQRPSTGLADTLPTVLGLGLAVAALWFLLRALRRAQDEPEMPLRSQSSQLVRGTRREFLLTGAGTAVVTAAALGTGTEVRKRTSVAKARASIALPRPASSAAPIPVGADLKIDGLAPFVTSNNDFYRIDTALLVPQVNPQKWRLRIQGMVEHPYYLSYDELLAMPMIERDVTLTCVSNEVGGQYISNARWLGVPLKAVLDKAGVSEQADQLLCGSVDGFTSSLSAKAALDGRDSMVALGMNGEVLPSRHGFPARLVVPGLYGYVSACKWISSIKATTYANDQAYWTVRGWAEQAPILTESRIDVPRDAATIHAGRVAVAGIAWAQHRGISKVEVQIDDGDWQQATLAETPSVDTWRQWFIAWDATSGRHDIRVRATDGNGELQTSQDRTSFPSGATGWDRIRVHVR